MKSFKSILAGGAVFTGIAQAAVSGFDISGYQESTDFSQAYADGDRFVFIKVSKPERALQSPIHILIHTCRLPRVPHTRAASSPSSTMARPTPDSSVVLTTSPIRRPPPAPHRLLSSPRTAVVGAAMASPSPALWTSSTTPTVPHAMVSRKATWSTGSKTS